MTQLTKTQGQLLSVLRAIRSEGEALIPEANARAIGGLTEGERNERLGVSPDGRYVGNCHTSTWAKIPGLNINTYHALRDAGLVKCAARGIWIAA